MFVVLCWREADEKSRPCAHLRRGCSGAGDITGLAADLAPREPNDERRRPETDDERRQRRRQTHEP